MNQNRTSSALAKGLTVIKALRGHSLNGLSNNDLVKATGESAATINRTLNTLIDAGFAEKMPSGRFSLSVAILGLAQAHAQEMANATDKINELNQRIAANANL